MKREGAAGRSHSAPDYTCDEDPDAVDSEGTRIEPPQGPRVSRVRPFATGYRAPLITSVTSVSARHPASERDRTRDCESEDALATTTAAWPSDRRTNAHNRRSSSANNGTMSPRLSAGVWDRTRINPWIDDRRSASQADSCQEKARRESGSGPPSSPISSP